MMYLDFEKPIVELETKIAELRALSDHKNMNLKDDLTRLERKVRSVCNRIKHGVGTYAIVKTSTTTLYVGLCQCI
ncbi:MAG: hypothetical protein R3A45_08675 [Bdellovibrionota bacterium]